MGNSPLKKLLFAGLLTAACAFAATRPVAAARIARFSWEAAESAVGWVEAAVWIAAALLWFALFVAAPFACGIYATDEDYPWERGAGVGRPPAWDIGATAAWVARNARHLSNALKG